jgi:hypothetical protein
MPADPAPNERGAQFLEVDLDQALARVRADIVRERGARGWLRSRPSWWRTISVAALVAVAVAITAARFARPDLHVYPLRRMLLVMGSYLVLCAWSVREVLRPVQARWRDHLPGALLALAIPWALALLPEASRAAVVPLAGHGHDCVAVGLLAGWLFILVLRAFGRDDEVRGARLVWMIGGAGVLANAVLVLHCPLDRPMHLLATHAVLGVALAVQYLLVRRWLRIKIA